MRNLGRALRSGVNPIHTVKRVAHYAGEAPKAARKLTFNVVSYGAASAEELRRRPVVGAARIAIQTTGVGAVALAAYDVKRLRDKTRNRIGQLRTIRRQALHDGDVIQMRLASKPGTATGRVNPLFDSIMPKPAQLANLTPTPNTALPGPAITAGAAPGGYADELAAPAPDVKGAGGDNAEGVRTVLAGPSKAIGAFLIVGLVLAVIVSQRGGENV